MKILHIGEYVNGGVATYLKTLIEDCKENDVEQYLLMSSYKSEKKWKMDKTKIKFYKYKRNIINIFLSMIKIQSYIKKIRPDIIHIHSSWAGVMVRIPYVFKKKDVKIIYTPHGWAFLMENSVWKKKSYAIIEKALSFVTDKIINISKYEQNRAIEYGIDSCKMQVIYNGVKGICYKSNKTINMKKEKINLLFVGRLDYQKGLDAFLKIYYQDEFPRLHLYVVGTGVLNESEMRNDSKTTYVGWVDNQEIDSYYQACDAVIMPSRWEGFGLTAIEAMRNKKTVIASNRGALPEIVDDCGYIFDFDSKSQLIKILNNLNVNKLKKLGEKGYERYLRLFNSQKFLNETIALEKSVCQNSDEIKNEELLQDEINKSVY